ncbi:MAG: YopX family protein [Thermaurantimonas sp.]
MMSEKRYRLRVDQKIIGYKRVIGKNYEFYSRNGLWWSGHILYYKQVDEFSGLKDKNDRHLYELDIVEYRIDKDIPLRKGVILWHKKDEYFCIKDLEDTGFLPISVDGVMIFNSRDLTFHSYLFINPEIMEMLGLSDD